MVSAAGTITVVVAGGGGGVGPGEGAAAGSAMYSAPSHAPRPPRHTKPGEGWEGGHRWLSCILTQKKREAGLEVNMDTF